MLQTDAESHTTVAWGRVVFLVNFNFSIIEHLVDHVAPNFQRISKLLGYLDHSDSSVQ